MKKSLPIVPAILLFVVNVLCPEVNAELSPESYANMQAEAPEAITAKIQRVTITKQKVGEDTVMDVVVVAKVADVTRSAIPLRPGQCVTVCYQRTERAVPLVGPGEIPLLKAGQECPMFLRCDEKKRVLIPAARSHSFTPMLARPTARDKDA